MNNSEKTALVLSGGGSKGAFQAGVLQVLAERGYRFDVISGVSVGTLNGAIIASGLYEQIVEIWEGIRPHHVYRERSLFTIARRYVTYKIGIGDPPLAKFDNRPLRELMSHHLGGRRVDLPFYFGFVRLETGEYVKATIDQEDGHTIDERDLDRMLASTAIPVIFNPVVVGGSVWVDGGLRNISPIGDVLPHDPSRVILIPTEPIEGMHGREEVRDIIQVAFKSINTMLDEIFREDIARFLSINRLVKQAEEQGAALRKPDGSAYRYYEQLIIAPEEPLGDALDFDPINIRSLMERGRKRAEMVLGG